MRSRKVVGASPGGGSVSANPAGPRSRSRRAGSTRASRAWVRVLPAVVLLAAILVFVLQNSRHATVSFLAFSGRIPLGVALLGAAALGGLLVLALGSVRMVQLRMAVRRAGRPVHDESANQQAGES
jgi:uncharacterized integral membrane protein